MKSLTGAWFLKTRSPIRGKLRLFCFPFAGGSAQAYRDWVNYLPPAVQVVPVELPGRGARMKEPAFVSLPSLVEALGEVIPPLLDVPFVFFGHSMGAMIAFELTRYLDRRYGICPQGLIVSGRRAPQVAEVTPTTYDLPHDELIHELYRLAGTPKEVLENAELMELLLPVIRADFQLVQTHEYIAGEPVRCPILAFGGLQDKIVTRESLAQWEAQTTSRFVLRMLQGDHFFIKSSQALLLECLAQELQGLIFGSPLKRASS